MGGVTWYLARTGARRRVWSGLGLVLLVGLTAAVVLATWAGARRTATSYERLEQSVNHADVTVATEGDPASFDPNIAVDGPGVASAGIVDGYPMALVQDGVVDLSRDFALIVPRDPTGFHTIDRPVVIEGRSPDPKAPDEITVPAPMVDQGFPLGGRLDVCLADFDKVLSFGQGVLEGTATEEVQRAFTEAVCVLTTLRVVGITGPGPDEVVLRADSEGPGSEFPLGSPAISQLPGVARFFSFVLVDLEDDADQGAYIDRVLDRTAPDAGVSASSSNLRRQSVARALDPYVRALTLFAVAVALAGLGVAGPAVARWAGVEPHDRSTLRAIGVSSTRLRVASALRGLVLGLLAAGVAVAVAIAVSDQFPRGVGARIEPDPGRRIDAPVLVVGSLGLIGVAVVCGALAPTTARTRVRRPSRVAEALQGLGLGPGRVAGVRSALSGDGRGAGVVPTVAGVTLALIAVIAALTYQAGLDRLLSDPVQYGWRWDEVIDTGDEVLSPEVVEEVTRAPEVVGLSVGYRSLLLRDGEYVQLFAFERSEGGPYPVILEGRAPSTADEIALGAQTLERLDASIGDVLGFRAPQGDDVELTVVGQTLLPISSFVADLSVGEGGLVTTDLVERFGVNEPGLALVDLDDDAPSGRLQAILSQASELGQLAGLGSSGPELTADLRSYHAVRRTPLLLAGALSLMGLGVLAHTVATSVGRRRLELSLLRSLGFVARDLRASVRWSVLTMVAACALIAAPLGIAVGRTLWDAFATSLGVESGPVTPVAPIAVVLVLALVAGLLFSIIPARQATSLRAAQVLRTE